MSGSKRGYMSHDDCEILTWILCGCLLIHIPFPRVGLVTDRMVTERDCWMICHSRHINGMVGLWAGLICVSGASLLLGNRGCWMKLFTWHLLLELTSHLPGVLPYEPRCQISAPSTSTEQNTCDLLGPSDKIANRYHEVYMRHTLQ